MEGSQQFDSAVTERLCAFPIDVAVRAAVYTVDRVYLTVPEREIVGMLGNGTGIFGTGADYQIGPFLRIKAFTLHHRDKILITEIVEFSIVLLMPLILGEAAAVHVSGIPFVLAGGNTVGTPVEKHTELGVTEPLGNLLLHG